MAEKGKKETLYGITDYIRWRGDITFDKDPFNAVDATIFAMLSYIPFDGIVTEDFSERKTLVSAAKEIFGQKDALQSIGAVFRTDKMYELFRVAAKSARFSSCTIFGFVNRVSVADEKQFSAICFGIPGETVLAFRGTDDTVVGWRENLNMSFKAPVPSQLEAEKYLNELLKAIDGKIAVVGHSKGGNLAVWSTAHAEEPERISAVYNLDGPGFTTDIRNQPGYENIKKKIRTIVPEKSVVGMFFKHEADFATVKSNAKGLLQHDALSWAVLGNRFLKCRSSSPETQQINVLLARWINDIDDVQREKFTESFFAVIANTNEDTLTGVLANKWELLKAFASADAETRDAVFTALRLLIGEKAKQIIEKKT